MRWRILIVFLILQLSNFNLYSQNKDTLKIMVYNILNYRNSTNQCTNSNNSPTIKENALEIIVDYTLPDVLVCNEVGASPNGFNSFTLMNSSLNQNGRTYYQMANYTSGFQTLTNMLYYNSNKLALKTQTTISKDLNNINLVRLIDIYTLYYKDPNLAQHTDTIFLHFIAAHLKAGNTTADRNERGLATEAVMAYLDTINATGNYFFMGDLNVYSPTEPAFLDLVNYTPDPGLNFIDPAYRIGNWSNNSSFSDVHTQSTHSGTSSCASGGGMDDRFDFILMSDEVDGDSMRVQYIAGTYKALGQDGMRFNGAINSPTNSILPFYVADALYDMSDHLPVMMDINLTLPLPNAIAEYSFPKWFCNNPVKDVLELHWEDENTPIDRIQILNVQGIEVKNLKGRNLLQSQFSVEELKAGLYFIKLTLKNGKSETKKIILI